MKIEKNKTLTFELTDESKTEDFGAKLGARLVKGDLVALTGTLGSGKTTLTAAIAKSLGILRNEVSSPTYVIMRPYMNGLFPVYHWDFYRLADPEELMLADFQEILADRKSLFIIEWAELFPTVWANHFPRYELTITQGATHDSRIVTLIYKG